MCYAAKQGIVLGAGWLQSWNMVLMLTAHPNVTLPREKRRIVTATYMFREMREMTISICNK